MTNKQKPIHEIRITRAALDILRNDEVLRALACHARAYWSDVTAEDREENELSLKEGFRLFSVYLTVGGRQFWIVTEADRSEINVELHINFLMLSLQKCEVEWRSPRFTGFHRQRIQHY